MSVSVYKAPAQFSFSENAIQLQLISDDFLLTAPVKAINRVEFTGEITAESTITLNWTGAAALMTAKAVPDNSGYQFPIGDGSNAYVQNLVAWFDGNYFINRDYKVAYDTSGTYPALVFNARKQGPKYNYTAYAALYATCSVQRAGSDGGQKQNFYHHLELWISNEAGDDFASAYDANIPLDWPVNGITSVDISDALHSFLGHDEPVQASLSALCTKSVRQYYFKYAQFFGANPAIQRVYTSAKYFIARGGLSKQAALIRDIKSELNPVAANPEQNRFMRQGSKNIIVTPGQPEWLTWLNLTGTSQDIALEVVITNRDNQSSGFFATTQTVANNQKVQFQTGFNQLNIAGMQVAAEIPAYYTVRIKAGDAYLTAPYIYVIDYRNWEWARYFIYENAYGAYQTLATVGKGQSEFDRLKDDAQRVTDQLSEALTGSFLECNISFQDKGVVAIGYQRTNDRSTKLLRSFFASEKVYLYRAGQLVPVGISTTNLKDAPDGENLYANSFEYYLLYQETNYTEDPALPDDDISILVPGNIEPITDADDFDEIADFGDDDDEFFDDLD